MPTQIAVSLLAGVTIVSSALAVYFHFTVGIPAQKETERELLIEEGDLQITNYYLLAKEVIAILLGFGTLFFV